MEDMKRAYRIVQERHEEYLNDLETDEDDGNLEAEEEWLNVVNEMFDNAEEKKGDICS